jgi:hypothetical protein
MVHGLGFNQEIPHHSTFSKNRHRRFQESKLFEQLSDRIVRQCVEVGLVQGKHLSVMAVSGKRMRPRRAGFRQGQFAKQSKSSVPCGSIVAAPRRAQFFSDSWQMTLHLASFAIVIRNRPECPT